VAEFSAEWLALREPADTAARSVDLTEQLVAFLFGARDRHPVTGVLDLAAGTGANLRHLVPHLPSPQAWLLVDHDRALLEEVAPRVASWAATRGVEVVRDAVECQLRGDRLACHFATHCCDLNMVDYADLVAGRALVTASALLDLVSEHWLRSLASACRQSETAVLFALTYDGRIACVPEEPEDTMIRDLVNRHQRTDKGFGIALGPAAPDVAQQCFADLGYRIRRATSDWILSPQQQNLQRELLEGWAQAATKITPEAAPIILDWRSRRLAHVDGQRSRLLVGHQDLAAWLPIETAR
jgi:hypothetical protein